MRYITEKGGSPIYLQLYRQIRDDKKEIAEAMGDEDEYMTEIDDDGFFTEDLDSSDFLDDEFASGHSDDDTFDL